MNVTSIVIVVAVVIGLAIVFLMADGISKAITGKGLV